mgnify:CR=1 FL=1
MLRSTTPNYPNQLRCKPPLNTTRSQVKIMVRSRPDSGSPERASPVSTIVKGVKRAMAGEYSRELSTKVFAGQCRLIELGYRQGGVAPIYTNVPGTLMVLPVPQALTLTSIVIGVATTALMLTMVVLIHRHTGETDAEKSRRVKG